MDDKSFISPGRLDIAAAIFGRAPSPGRTKTRLIRVLGAQGAASLTAILTQDTIRKVNELPRSVGRYFFLAGRKKAEFIPAASWVTMRQRGCDLGERLERAFRGLLHRHSSALIIGTDSPLLTPAILRVALRELRASDAVLGPCFDGGYYLIGLRGPMPNRGEQLLAGVRWGSNFAYRDTLRNFLQRGLICSILEPLADVDRPEDLKRLESELCRDRTARRLAPATWKFLRELRNR